MKIRWTILAVVAVGLTGFAVPRTSAEYVYSEGVDIRDAGDFHGPLTAYGNWVQTDSYGLCWYPAYVDNSWRPYTNGLWQWTDGGWYWTSDEPWAWATYHYGRWVYDTYYGWLWTPGTQWAPAWVSWREGGDYIGWAPLPPGCDFGPQGTTIYADQVIYAPNTFVFVDRRHFCEPIRPSVVIVNQTIENKTINITRIQRINQVVINHGPRVDGLQQVTKHVMPYAQIHDLRADIASTPQRGHIPATHEDRVVHFPPQGPGRDVPVVHGSDRSRDDHSPVAQSVANNGRSDAGRMDKRHGRDIGDDSSSNGRRN
jgi:hypothetical protein